MIESHKRKQTKILDKFFLAILGIFLFSVQAWGFFPHKKDSTEFRVVVTSTDFSDYEWHGKVIGGKLLHKDLQVSGLLEMTKKQSALKGLITYQLNKFVSLGLSAGLDNQGSGVGDFLITGHVPVGKMIEVFPFIKVTHNVLGQVGLVLYFIVKKVVFNMGISYQPPIGDHQTNRYSLMLGTGL